MTAAPSPPRGRWAAGPGGLAAASRYRRIRVTISESPHPSLLNWIRRSGRRSETRPSAGALRHAGALLRHVKLDSQGRAAYRHRPSPSVRVVLSRPSRLSRLSSLRARPEAAPGRPRPNGHARRRLPRGAAAQAMAWLALWPGEPSARAAPRTTLCASCCGQAQRRRRSALGARVGLRPGPPRARRPCRRRRRGPCAAERARSACRPRASGCGPGPPTARARRPQSRGEDAAPPRPPRAMLLTPNWAAA